MSKQYRPGQKAPVSGQYEIIGPRGGRTGKERTVEKGEILPPTPERDQTYCITNHTKVHVTSRGGLYVKADGVAQQPQGSQKNRGHGAIPH